MKKNLSSKKGLLFALVAGIFLLTCPGLLQAAILYENFDSGIEWPAGWTEINANPENYWRTDAGGWPDDVTGYYARAECNWKYEYSTTSALISPTIKASDMTLNFQFQANHYWSVELNKNDLNVWAVVGDWDKAPDVTEDNDVLIAGAVEEDYLDDFWDSWEWFAAEYEIPESVNDMDIRIAFENYQYGKQGAIFEVDEVNVNAIPIPGALWLLGSGLVGLIGIQRRRLIAHSS